MELRKPAGKGHQPSKDNENSLASGAEAAKVEKTSKKRKRGETDDESSSDTEITPKRTRPSVGDKIRRAEEMQNVSRGIQDERYARLGIKKEDAQKLIEMTENALKDFAELHRIKDVINTSPVTEQTHQELESLNTERLNYTIQHFPDDLLGKFQNACMDRKYMEYHKNIFPKERSNITQLSRLIPSLGWEKILGDFDLICDNTIEQDNRPMLRKAMKDFEHDIKELHQQLNHPSEVINRITGKIEELNDTLVIPGVELLRMRREELGSPSQLRDRKLAPQDYIPPTADQLRNAFRTFKDKVKDLHERDLQDPLFKEIVTKLNDLEEKHEVKRLIDDSTNLLGKK